MSVQWFQVFKCEGLLLFLKIRNYNYNNFSTYQLIGSV